jgi:uncharacterized protein with HEPN domain
MARPVDKLLDDILAAIGVGDEIVRRGRSAFDRDPVLQYGAEAVIGHIGDAASKLPSETCDAMPEVQWKATSALGLWSITSTTDSSTVVSG